MSESPHPSSADHRLARACLDGDTGALESFAGQFHDLLDEPYEAFALRVPDHGLRKDEFAAHVARISSSDFLAVAGAEDASSLNLRFFVGRLALEDLALALACARGAEGAWQVLERSYAGRLRALVSAVAKSPGDAEEITSTLFGDLYLSRDRREGGALAGYRGRARLTTWLRVIVHCKAADFYDSRHRTLSLASIDRSDREEALARVSVMRDSTPDGLAERRERLDRLEGVASRVLGALDPRDRELVEAYYLRGETVQSISRAFGVHKASVSRWLKRVRERLLLSFRRALGPDDLAEDDDVFWNTVGREFRLRLGEPAGKAQPVREKERSEIDEQG